MRYSMEIKKDLYLILQGTNGQKFENKNAKSRLNSIVPENLLC
jgi:hypothetical protein